MAELPSSCYPNSTRCKTVYAMLLVVTLWTFSSLHVTPQIPTELGFAGIDKLLHFLMYGLVGTLIVRAKGYPIPLCRAIFSLLLTIAAGMIEETIQAFNPFRQFEWYDLLADTSGGLVAILAYRHIRFYRYILELRLFATKRFD
jgi:VanZ family protein